MTHLWNRVAFAVIGVCVLLQAWLIVQRLVAEDDAPGLSVFLPLLAGGTVFAIWKDHHRGHFAAGRFGSASAICVLVWFVFILGIVIWNHLSASCP